MIQQLPQTVPFCSMLPLAVDLGFSILWCVCCEYIQSSGVLYLYNKQRYVSLNACGGASVSIV